MSKSKNHIRVGVDTGGTFTDFVYVIDDAVDIFKLPSTPSDPSAAIRDGLNQICEKLGVSLNALDVVHGTTVGTNALLQRRGARTALVTTEGFEDVLVIGRQARPELYNLNAQKPPALVADELRFGVAERVVASGEVLEELSADAVNNLVKSVKDSGAESVAISLLFSFLHHEHEERIATALGTLGVPLSVSNRILPEYREYERTSTVVINAYLQPLMGKYLSKVQSPESKVESFSLRVMQSSGGSISAEVAAAEPVRTVLSGPAGGVVGALRVARSAGLENIITFDMGGTSTDVALCNQSGIRTTNEATVAGLPIAVSVMDIHTVGAGGGSIAQVDAGGSLRVGPESAGADPGPACYGRSFLPTVTDAHVVLGHFGGRGLLGSSFQLDETRSNIAIEKLAKEISEASGRRCSTVSAAEGIIAVANTNMERALRHISVERGYDPRQFALLPFGGAGGLHAVALARALRVPLVIVPRSGGALSAIGVVVADVVKDQSRTVMLSCDGTTTKRLEQTFREMEKEGRTVLQSEGFSKSRQKHQRSFAMRYLGQSFELEVDATGGDVATAFHRAHRERYGYAQEGSEIQIVSARLRSFGIVDELRELKIARRRSVSPEEWTSAYVEGKRQRVAIYARDNLRAGVSLKSPCIVTEYSATTLIPAGVKATVDIYGNLLLSL